MMLRADRRADTAVARGAMHMARDAELLRLGVVLDTSVRSSIADTYLKPVRVNSANTDGFAAKAGDKQKRAHYDATSLNPAHWRLVPFIEETLGRLDDTVAAFLRQLASHAAACKGSDSVVIRRRAAIMLQRMTVRLSASLHAELAERVFVYVRGARQEGWTVRPVSAHLHTIAPSVVNASAPVGSAPSEPPPA